MQLRGKLTPAFDHQYLVDAATARMAGDVIVSTDSFLVRRKYEKTLREYLSWLYGQWNRTLARCPKWDGAKFSDLHFDKEADERLRFTVLAGAAYASPLDVHKGGLTEHQRLVGLRGLAKALWLDQTWGDRVLEVRASALAAHPQPTSTLSPKALVGLIPGLASDQPAGTDAEAVIAPVVRLQIRVGFVDAWAQVDPASVDREIRALAERRAELDSRQDDAMYSERERVNAGVERQAVERALFWLQQEQSRALSRV